MTGILPWRRSWRTHAVCRSSWWWSRWSRHCQRDVQMRDIISWSQQVDPYASKCAPHICIYTIATECSTTPHPRYHLHRTQRSFSDQPEKSACPLKHHQQEKHSQAQSCVVLSISNILQGGHTNLHDPLFHRPFDDIPRNVDRFILT